MPPENATILKFKCAIVLLLHPKSAEGLMAVLKSNIPRLFGYAVPTDT